MQLLLQFIDPLLQKRAMTFKSYQQEYNGRNKDNPLIQGNNDVLIDFGSEILNFLYMEFLVYQGYPKSDANIFKSFSEMQKSKESLLNDAELAKISNFLRIDFLLSVNPQSNIKLKENPKFHAQAIKALIGAQYFDKQKDINKMRKLLQPLYEELVKSLKLIKFEQPVNPKGIFNELIQKFQNKYEINYKFSQQESEHPLENKQQYSMQLLINEIIPIQREGVQKKEVERQLYTDGVKVLKDPRFEKLLQDKFSKRGVFDSFESHINQSYVDQPIFDLEGPGPSGMLQSQIQQTDNQQKPSSSILQSEIQQSDILGKTIGIIADFGEQKPIEKLVSDMLAKYN